MFSNYTDINLASSDFQFLLNTTRHNLNCNTTKKIILQNIITLKNSDKLIKNDVQRYRNKKNTKTLETLIIHRKTN